MRQLLQKLRDGRLRVLDVPPPIAGPGMVLVRNRYSLISAGTEGGTVRAARQGLVGKAMARPREAGRVIEVMRSQGPVQAYRAVMKKLESHSPLGYSSAGEVMAVGEGVRDMAAGDRAACAGGGYASHAEVVAVPRNLCVRLSEGADLRLAAMGTVGAIALQGIRRAGPSLGECCVVIGLGLIGQLTCLMLRASGVRVVGVDVDERMAVLARTHAADLAMSSDDETLPARVFEMTHGVGADSAIIAAATASTGPVNLAGRLLRKRGRVVVVGDVPTGFDREPDYYRKELELLMSCSYGPGRYDPRYEEKGIDYPAGYVRWTENRNMEAFQALLHSGKIAPDYLITHEVPLEDAPRAFDMILAREEPVLGVLIAYAPDAAPIPAKGAKVALREAALREKALPGGGVGVSFIGAGSYATGTLLPNMPRDVSLRGVMSLRGAASRSAAERFGFSFCTSSEDDVFGDTGTNAVVIATRHDSHALYALGALGAGKCVFVEKPVALTPGELERLAEAVREGGMAGPFLMAGYNRRFSPLTEALREWIGAGPVAMLYRISAGSIPSDHWVHDPERGGGRVLGEVCHFVDFMTYVSGSLPVRVMAEGMKDAAGLGDTLTASIAFENGSVGAISYFANGPRTVEKEYIEVFGSGRAAVIRDFRVAELSGESRTRRKKLLSQDKGQRRMLEAFIAAVRAGGASPIPFEEIHAGMLATFAIEAALRAGREELVGREEPAGHDGPDSPNGK